DPADPALRTPLAARSCIRLGVMPWRQVDGTTLLACTAPATVDRSALERLLGPVRLAQCAQADIDAALTQRHGSALIARAEASVPPAQSCRNMHHLRGRLSLMALACLAGLATVLAPLWVLSALTMIALLSMVAAQGVKVAALLMARTAAPPAPPQISDPGLPPVTLLIPLFKERDIATVLLRRLHALRYPRDRLDVLLILEDDDTQTRAAIRATPLAPWMRVVVVPRGHVRTKPRAMNYALTFAKGTIVGIYDAEDAPDPDQLLQIAARFRDDSGVDCLQGILDYYNPCSNWLSRCFTIEYAVWFRLLLPGLVRMGFAIPLGGTTVFIRRHVLDAVHGWDAHNVTEDADLGLRLARYGYRTDVVHTVTREEANNRAWPWVRQRSRWLKGYIVTYLVHMRRPAALWHDLGPWRFIGVQLVLLTAIVQFTLAPVLWSFWALPLGLGHP
ncbi:MAG: glycosyltransferase family 2 protein, partial [Primorskyibacter sp.]